MGPFARLGTSFVTAALLSAPATWPSRAAAGVVPCSATDLVNAIQAAVTAGGPQTVDLSPACTYTLTAVHSGAGLVEASGLPYIRNVTTPVALTINGNGATITRNAAAPQFRFFLVFQSNGLTLNDLTLSNGRAADIAAPGGASGGAIDNQGTLTLNSVTLAANAAGDGFGTSSPGGSGGALSNSGNASIAGSIFNGNNAGNGGTTGANPGIGGSGGAIVNSGTLDITSSSLVNSRAGDGGMGAPQAAGGSGGAISNNGMLNVQATTVNSNFAGNGGDNAASVGGSGGPGGGIASHLNSTLNLSNSTVSNNIAGDGGSGQTGGAAGTGGGIHTQATTTTVSGVTINSNAAGNGGDGTTTGGAGGNGGGMALFGLGSFEVVNSTISANVAGNAGSGGTPSGGAGGGMLCAAFNFSGNTRDVTNCTITGNGAAMGGGIRVPGAGVPQLRNTIVAGNSPGENCSGVIGNVTNNLDGGTTCGFMSSNSSISGGNANLGPLQDNGGPTFTHALLEPSNAIDAGNDLFCAAAPINNVDQRGVVRPQGAHCDIGAFESAAAPATPTAIATATHTVATTASHTATANASVTPTATRTPTVNDPGPTATASATPGLAPSCGGDCDAGRTVTVDEIIRGVNIALGTTLIDDCFAFDIDGGGTVTVDEIVTAVNHALMGCPAAT